MTLINVFMNNSYIILIIAKSYLWIDISIKRLFSKVPIYNFNEHIYYSNKLIVTTFYLKMFSRTVIAITNKFFIIDKLKANILINIDIITLEEIDLDFNR